MATVKQPPVTIIVPVYGDWPSLNDCVDSLIKHAPQSCEVLFANDHGPEWQTIATQLQAKIAGHKNFEYMENAENLGFVQNCNNAVANHAAKNHDVLLLNSDTVVTENFLQELSAVAYSSDRIGTVCPRSNDATISTVPLFSRSGQTALANESYAIYSSVKQLLPRLKLTPVSVGFCMYIKRKLIDKYGLFDTIYGKGYGEENDFCMRLNQVGYVSVMANWSYVFHQSAKSFTPAVREQLIEENEAKLVERYPQYRNLVENYLNYDIDAVDYFSELIAGPENSLKLLIDLHSLPAHADEDIKAVKQLLDELPAMSNVLYTVAAPAPTWRALAVTDAKKFEHAEPHAVKGLFDVGYSPLPITDVNNAVFLFRHCLKVVASSTQKDVCFNTVFRSSAAIDILSFFVFNEADAIVCQSADEAEQCQSLLTVQAEKLLVVTPGDELINMIKTICKESVDPVALRQRWLKINDLQLVQRARDATPQQRSSVQPKRLFKRLLKRPA